jgi:hypothetical protein
MRSRSVRLSCVVVAWIALGATAFFVVSTEQQLAARRAARRVFDFHAREVASALSDLRAAQLAYVAAGQGVAVWMPKVAQTSESARSSIATLREAAADAATRASIDEAADTLARFTEIDTRARDYLRSGQVLMAGDIIFAEGSQLTASAARNIEAARLAEDQALEALETGVRRQEAFAIAAAAAVSAAGVLLLGVTGGSTRESDESASLTVPQTRQSATQPTRPTVPGPPVPAPVRAVSPVLRTAAQLCTDFACVRDVNDLQMLLTRASDVMDAAGLVVWLGSAEGDDLQPVMTQGYNDETRARLPSVPRSANNAAAAAYRSGDVQIVLSRPGGAKGAIVAPIRGAQGCVGALSVEIRGGGEASESVQALATIVAAQLAGVLVAPHADAPDARAAASS